MSLWQKSRHTCITLKNDTSGLCFRLLEKFRALAPSRIRDRLGSYIEAYKSGAKRPKTCKEKYTCDKPKFMMAHADTYYNLL
jgi:hypothetical protein